MKRLPWDFILALLIGLGIGLIHAWVISPLHLTNAQPSLLRADFKDQFRETIAASYASTGNLPRAQARLTLLGDSDIVSALNAQAQRDTATGQFIDADLLASLAAAIENGGSQPPQPVPTTISVVNAETGTVTPFPSPADIPFVVTASPQSFATSTSQSPLVPGTIPPRPTRTPTSTQGAPFRISAFDTICDPDLPEGLLQVIVFNPNRRQMAGIEVIVAWDTGSERFFTGFKPELGNGYADFEMTPEVTYSIQLGVGSETATGILAPTCQSLDGEIFTGGYKMTFQQP